MFGLSFLSPLFLVGLAAAAIPVAIHLFYRRTEPVVEFAAMRYLRRAPVEESKQRRLRELLLLALRAFALALLACAFARPYVTEAAAGAADSVTLVLVDTSASLTAPGQFDSARERALQVVRETPTTHAVGVLTFAQTSALVAPVSRDRARALAAIGQLMPGAGATRYRAALQRAAVEFAGRPGRIVLITDLQQSGWDIAAGGGVPDNVSVVVERVQAPEANLAVTALTVEDGDAVAVVRSFSPRSSNDQVVFSVDGTRIGAVPVAAAGGAHAEARLPLGDVTSGALSAAVADRVGYAADNVRYAVLDADSNVAVLAVTGSGHPSDVLYVERALTVASGIGGFRVRSVSGAALSSLDEQILNDVDVIVLLGTRGLEQRSWDFIKRFLEAGGGALIAAGPEVEPEVLRQTLADVMATSWRPGEEESMSFAPDDSRHPVFRPFGGVGTLGNVSFTRTARLTVPDTATVIARYTNGMPALVEERTGGGRILVFGSDLNYRWNDFPLQPAFVPFLHEVVRYLAASRTTRSDYLVGDLIDESGSRPGVVRIDRAGQPASDEDGRRVAVNVNPREADPSPMTEDDFQAGISRLQAGAAQEAAAGTREQEGDQGLWQYGLLFMVVSLVAEGLLGRRLG